MLKVVIIDDEFNGREVLAQLLTSFPDLSIVGFADSAKAGIDIIVKQKPDIVFLDIEMPNGSGFTILDDEEVQQLNFSVIFTTAYEKYALKAIKYAALDYLLKPIDRTELKDAIDRVRKKGQPDTQSREWIEDLRLSLNRSSRLKLVSRDGFEMVDINNIVYVKAETNYTMFYFDNDTPKLVSKTMKVYQFYLEQNGFMRIHRSHMINLQKLVKYNHGKGGQVEMKGKKYLDVSPDFKKNLMEAMDNIL